MANDYLKAYQKDSKEKALISINALHLTAIPLPPSHKAAADRGAP
jgi:hypothetical protein